MSETDSDGHLKSSSNAARIPDKQAVVYDDRSYTWEGYMTVVDRSKDMIISGG
ncbi:hypothetical protein [Lentibacillus kimchii]|uniref:Uncharacterized protein n=1 Tax=Lentibacillus kimchii TaxID=1542911 RepID=A0ABW2UTP4_9BACI